MRVTCCPVRGYYRNLPQKLPNTRFIHTPPWEGVPFIMKAGKALEERKGELRIQFKDAPAARFMFDGVVVPRNELVLRLQPSEVVYFKVTI